jgi:lipoprotein-anchoring transpeptidase ErfK/SrfK
MMFVRGLFWTAMVVAMGPELIPTVRAEPPMAVATEAAPTVTAPATPDAPKPVVAAAVKLVPAPKPVITLQANVDLTRQTLVVMDRGKTVGTWKISSGVSEEFATPRGAFQPEWSAKMWYSRKYDDAPMPHAVFFKSGAAIHATQSVGALGRPASHGCVRLAPTNAETFYNLVQRHGLSHTRIHVYGTPNYPRPMVAQKPASTPRQLASPGFGTTYRAASGASYWSGSQRPVQYANSGPFAGPFAGPLAGPLAGTLYPRLPIAAARNR